MAQSALDAIPEPERKSEADIRAILKFADINVLRIALYQQTGDQALSEIPPIRKQFPGTPYETYTVPEEHHATIVDKAVAYLMDPKPPVNLALNPDEVRRLAALFEGVEVDDSVAEFVYEEMAFDGFKRQARWPGDRPNVPQGFEVLIIGAGFSAVICAIQLDVLGIRFRIVERQHDWGGTWLLNTYPDARVDITNFIYSFTLEPDYPWQHAFAPREELMAYVNHVVDKYNLRQHAVFNTRVVHAQWSENAARWLVDVERADGERERLTPNVVLSCAGLFSTPKFPAIEGIESFEGRMFHTTAWDQDYDYAGKRVALIGTGSTGSQLLPRVAEKAEHVAVYQRTPNWVTPVGRYRAPIPEERKWLLRNMPGYAGWNRYSFVQASVRNQAFQYLDEDWRANGGLINEKNDQLRAALIAMIRAKMVEKPELIDDLIPEFAPLSRRIVVDNGWYDALVRDNVELITDTIDRITPRGIASGGNAERDFDLIVLAAGFEVEKYLWPVQYVGRGGLTIEDLWSVDGARAYLTMTLPGFPNFFMMYGPNAGVRAGSFHSAVEMLSRYICETIASMLERGATSVELKRSVYDDYNARLDEGMKSLLWEVERGGDSYYLNSHGKSGVNMPWEMHEFYDFVRRVNPADYKYTSAS